MDFEKWFYVVTQSGPMGNMDYTFHLSRKYDTRLAVIDNVAYNNLDFGNYLWGAGMAALGFNCSTSLYLADYYWRVRMGS